MNSVNIANTSIDIHSGCIGISASGGADSAILLYILMANLDSHSVLHTFTGQADSGNSGWPSKVNDFVKRCTELTGFDRVVQHVFHIPGENTPSGLMAPLYKLADDPDLALDIMYTGVTSDPPDSVLATFRNPAPFYQRRNPNQTRPVYHLNRKWYTPFWNINKMTIANMYQQLSVMGQLFDLTFSCDNNSADNQHCGHCWWCEERQWAFGKL